MEILFEFDYCFAGDTPNALILDKFAKIITAKTIITLTKLRSLAIKFNGNYDFNILDDNDKKTFNAVKKYLDYVMGTWLSGYADALGYDPDETAIFLIRYDKDGCEMTNYNLDDFDETSTLLPRRIINENPNARCILQISINDQLMTLIPQIKYYRRGDLDDTAIEQLDEEYNNASKVQAYSEQIIAEFLNDPQLEVINQVLTAMNLHEIS